VVPRFSKINQTEIGVKIYKDKIQAGQPRLMPKMTCWCR